MGTQAIDQKCFKKQNGNVLFLILIAVALFAALTYVIVQSTRSGSGSTDREKSVLSSSELVQYPTALRTGVLRMVLAGISIDRVKFDTPGSAGFMATSVNFLVFSPSGGGANFQAPSVDLSGDHSQLQWRYNANFDIPGVGADGAGGNDIIAFLPGVSDSVCKQVNQQLGIQISGTCTGSQYLPTIDTSVLGSNVDMIMDSSYTFPPATTDEPNIQGNPTASCTVFSKQASGCFFDAANNRNVYFSAILER